MKKNDWEHPSCAATPVRINQTSGREDIPSLHSPDRWVATLAHELRNPLNGLLLNLDELRPCCGAGAQTREAYTRVERLSRQMARVIENVLDLCRGAQGTLALNSELLNVGKIVCDSVALVRPLIMAKNQRLLMLISPGLPCVSGQASRLEQVVTNLLTNASKFAENDGSISVIVESDARAILIRVRDDGIGIPHDLLPEIFHVYRRGPLARLGGRQGLGIGLALAKSLVELHHGRLTAHSDGPGLGSEFIVELPLGAALADTQANSLTTFPAQWGDDA
jgi:signal transduction histidine kinase